MKKNIVRVKFSFENIKFLGKISNDWPNDLFETNVYRTLNCVDNYC